MGLVSVSCSLMCHCQSLAARSLHELESRGFKGTMSWTMQPGLLLTGYSSLERGPYMRSHLCRAKWQCHMSDSEQDHALKHTAQRVSFTAIRHKVGQHCAAAGRPHAMAAWKFMTISPSESLPLGGDRRQIGLRNTGDVLAYLAAMAEVAGMMHDWARPSAARAASRAGNLCG